MGEFKENAIIVVSQDGWLLENFEEFWDDEDVIFAAVNNAGLALQFASDRLRADKGIVLEAVNNTGTALQFASNQLKADKAVVLAAVKNDPYALSDASEELKVDDDVLDACEFKED